VTPDKRADQPASIVRPAIVMAAFFGSIGAFFPYIAVYYASIDLSVESIGFLIALQAAVSLAAAPLWGALVDQLGTVRGSLLIGALGTALGATLLALAPLGPVIVVGVVVLALAGSGIIPMLDSRTVDILGADRDRYGRARAWGSAAFIVVAIAVGALIDRVGARGLFLVYVPGMILTGLAGWALLSGESRAGRRVLRVTRAEVVGLVRRRGLAIFLAGSILLWTSVAAFNTFFSIHLLALGAPAEVVGVAWALGALVEVPLMLTFHRIVARVGPERLIVIGVVATALRAAGFALAPNVPLTLAVSPLGGAGYAFFYVGTVTFVSRNAPARLQATAQGIFSGTAFSVGTILGSTIGGQLAGLLGLRGLFGVCAVGAALAAVVVATGLSRSHVVAPPSGVQPGAPLRRRTV
jgi:MFS transporter, PPP family, 3-phenylpropionic acid transporter